MALLSFSAAAQNIVPVQATTNGVLISPRQFLSTNIHGAGNISILPALSGYGVIISNTAGDVTQGQLNSASNVLRVLMVTYDNAASNYLYSLIVGGGAGEVNLNANAGTTNASIFGWVNPKAGVTNFLKTVSPGHGMAITNQTTNLVLAVDDEVIASQPQLNSVSNLLRTMIFTNAVASSNGLFNVTIANDVITINYITGIMTTRDITTSNGVITVITATSNGLDTLIRTKQHGTANLTNWSLYPTSVLNGWQAGTALLTNFQSMGISNIVAGTNAILYTNSGQLVINALPPGGSGGTGIQTNGGSGTNNIFTSPFLYGAQTNASNYYMAWPGFYFGQYIAGGPNAFLSGGLTVHGIFTADVPATFADDVTILGDLYIEGATLDLTFGTLLAQGVHLTGGQGGSSILRTDSSTNIVAATIGDGLAFDGETLSAEVTTAILNTASNVLRSFTISNGGTVSNALVTTITNASSVTSNALRLVIDSKQHGTALLTNFSAMGITNIVAGTNAIIHTNAGVLVVSAVPMGGSGVPLSITNFTNSVTGWSPPAGTTRIKIRAWGAGGDGGALVGANPSTGGGGGGYGESIFTSSAATSYDLFVGAPSGFLGASYVRLAGVGVDLMRVAGGTNGSSGAEPAVVLGAGGNVILADWGVPGETGWNRVGGFYGGQGGSSFGSSGGQGGNDWTSGDAPDDFGDGKPGRTPGGGGGGARGNIDSIPGTGGLGMIVIESFGSP